MGMLLLLAPISQAAAQDPVGLVEGDLDDTTLGLPFFGGGKTESKPTKKSAPKEASGGDGAWLTNFLGRLGGGATPTTGQSKPMRGQRVVVRKAEPTQGFEQSGFVRPPSMFRQNLVRAPLVFMISFFVGSGIIYALIRPRDGTLDYQPLLSA